jgi:dihydroorotase
MDDVGMVLCIHGELPDSSVLDREVDFLPILLKIADAFPNLRIVLEHVSSAPGVKAVDSRPNIAGSITAHHLLLTIDDVLSDGGMRPYLFCKPVAKSKHDRAALLEVATSGHPKFFFGSDSAPHRRAQKESGRVPAGVFTSPVAISVLVGVFEVAGALVNLEAFTSVNGANFYQMPVNDGSLTIEESPWEVPDSYGDVVPLCAGEVMRWSVRPREMASTPPVQRPESR